MSKLSERITKTYEGMQVWQKERAIFEVTERICELMEERKVSRADLAKKLGKSRAHVTQMLNGKSNMTLGSISDFFLALDRQIHIDDCAVTIALDHGPTCISILSTSWEFDEDEVIADDVPDVNIRVFDQAI